MYLLRKFVSFIIILIHVSPLLEFVSTQSDPPRNTFVAKLSHYLSYDSPFYNASTKLSPLELSLLDLKNSIARAKFLTTADTSLYDHTDDIEAPVWSDSSGFLVHIKVGSQLTNQFVNLDTGSGLLWINCEPCGHNVPAPIFDPSTSTTFRDESCQGTTFCYQNQSYPVIINCYYGPCTYRLRYANGNSKGKLARESFMFANTNKILENIRFGCARSTTISTNGVMGLNNRGVSILSQLGAKKFGYCTGNISDKAYHDSFLVVGDGTKEMRLTTPITIDQVYYLNLIGIKVGEKTVEFNPAEFKRNPAEHTGGMLVDTGSTYTFMPQSVLDQINEFIADTMDLFEFHRNDKIHYNNYRMLCYDGIIAYEQGVYLVVEFQFEGQDAIMEFFPDSLFIQMDDKSFCLAILPSELMELAPGISIMGNLLQQYHYITYDLANNEASFDRVECKEIKRLY